MQSCTAAQRGARILSGFAWCTPVVAPLFPQILEAPAAQLAAQLALQLAAKPAVRLWLCGWLGCRPVFDSKVAVPL